MLEDFNAEISELQADPVTIPQLMGIFPSWKNVILWGYNTGAAQHIEIRSTRVAIL